MSGLFGTIIAVMIIQNDLVKCVLNGFILYIYLNIKERKHKNYKLSIELANPENDEAFLVQGVSKQTGAGGFKATQGSVFGGGARESVTP